MSRRGAPRLLLVAALALRAPAPALAQCVNVLYSSSWAPAYMQYAIGACCACSFTEATYAPSSTAGTQFITLPVAGQRLAFYNENKAGSWDNPPPPDDIPTCGRHYVISTGPAGGVFSLVSGVITQLAMTPACPSYSLPHPPS